MSRDFTPKDWGIIHAENPDFRNQINNIIIVDNNGNKIPLITQERKLEYEKYPRLNLIGCDFLDMCFNEGIFSMDHGPEVIRMVENILLHVNYCGYEDFAEKVDLWYNGQLVPGHYMDNNNEALVEEVKKVIKNWKE